MKRVLAMALALCMVLALLPATAMAEETHTHCACAHAFTGLDTDKCTSHNEAQTWTELDPASLPTSGHYYLTADLVLTAQWKITGDLHLCTNGFDVTAGLDESPAYGWIRVDNGDTLTITNCKAQITNGKLNTADSTKNSVFSGANGTGTYGAMIHVNQDANLKLYGVEVSANTTSSSNTAGWGAGAVLACNTGITLDVAYAAFRNNRSSATNGGALSIRGGTANIRNTVFSGNYAEKSGAAIYMCNAVTSVTVTDCDFTDNEAKSGEGGAALYIGKGSANLTNVTMTGNKSSGTHGSAITQYAGTSLKLNSCNITGNTNTSNDKRAAVVAIGLVTEISVSGNTVISDNTNNGKEQNLFLRDYNGQAILTVDALTSGAKISMYTIDDLEPSAYLTSTAMTRTFEASDGYLIYENRLDATDKTYGIGFDGAGFAYGVPGHYHADCGCAIATATCKDHTSSAAEKVLWTAWDEKASANYQSTLPTSGHYYLTSNVIITGNMTLGGNSNPADVSICTNGFDITYAYDANNAASEPIRLYNGELTITNCKAQVKEGKLDTTDPAKTSTISGGETTASSAGFFRLDTGSLNLYGVELKDNETSSTNKTWTAGAIMTTNANSNLNVGYCAFNENNALTTRAGAISLQFGTADIRNTTFKGNTSATDGSAMLIRGGNATLVDCAIEENISGSSGAIYLVESGKVYMTNVTMTANHNNGTNGSAITAEGGTTVALNSCNITANTNKDKDVRAAVVTIDAATITVTGNTVVTGNTNGGVERNLFLRTWEGTPKLTVGQLTEGANVSVATSATEADPDTFLIKSFDGNYQRGWISYSDGSLVDYNTTDGFCFISTVTEGGVTYKPWADEEELPASGEYYLLENVALAASLELENAELKLNLNGKTVTGTTVATLGEGADLTIVTDGGKLTGEIQVAGNGAKLTADCDIDLNLNGKTATVNAEKVTLTDTATDNGTVGGKLYGDFELANTVTKDEETHISYVAVPGTDADGDYYTANAVRVKVKRINVRPGTAGLYYTTEVIFNQNIADLGATYGVALSLANAPGSDFATDEDTLYTTFTAPTGANFNTVATSCLLNNILKTGDSGNAARGADEIHANAYVKVGDIVVMMENTSDVVYSLKTVMQALDAKLGQEVANGGAMSQTSRKALSFFETWQSDMAGWSLTNMAQELANYA